MTADRHSLILWLLIRASSCLTTNQAYIELGLILDADYRTAGSTEDHTSVSAVSQFVMMAVCHTWPSASSLVIGLH